ncbi:hypothetical protein D8674_029373 [Pyrus ussuriensis x Pyrus communis]|uniref:Uncharacterized protein n=1 Tax=Pyrus ussuriensis x Pyrus communis TaxID=2448454 RepID=A0A5N5HYX9_9ROSA|nr:hypothetical protein D8674_029373 [Pyrus ussuriensis x Pyrus communis]
MLLSSSQILCCFSHRIVTSKLGFRLHGWTGRYKTHMWDNICNKEGQSRKGRQGKAMDSQEGLQSDVINMKDG